MSDDACLIELGARVIDVNDRFCQAAEEGRERLTNRLLAEVERLAEQLAHLAPTTLDGAKAKAKAAWAVACCGGAQPQRNGLNDLLAFPLVADLAGALNLSAG